MAKRSFHLVCTLCWNSQEKNWKLQEVISLAEFKASSQSNGSLALNAACLLSLRRSPADLFIYLFLDRWILERHFMGEYFDCVPGSTWTLWPVLNQEQETSHGVLFDSNKHFWWETQRILQSKFFLEQFPVRSDCVLHMSAPWKVSI